MAHGDYAQYAVKIQTDRLEWVRGGICFPLILQVLSADFWLLYDIQNDNAWVESYWLGVSYSDIDIIIISTSVRCYFNSNWATVASWTGPLWHGGFGGVLHVLFDGLKLLETLFWGWSVKLSIRIPTSPLSMLTAAILHPLLASVSYYSKGGDLCGVTAAWSSVPPWVALPLLIE